jgi:hypothetical protein
MSDSRHETFDVGGRPRIEVSLPSGDIVFLPGESGKVEVDVEGRNAEDLAIEQRGGRILLRTPDGLGSRWESFDVTVRTPAGAEVDVRAASADVDVQVALGSLGARLASGDIRVGEIEGDATLESASGDVELGEVGGNLDVSTASGDVQLGRAGGRVVVHTASGGARLGSRMQLHVGRREDRASTRAHPGRRPQHGIRRYSQRLSARERGRCHSTPARQDHLRRYRPPQILSMPVLTLSWSTAGVLRPG